jgi:hypothetical protein
MYTLDVFFVEKKNREKAYEDVFLLNFSTQVSQHD